MTREAAMKPGMVGADSRFDVRLAADDADLRAAQKLRYDVFVRELGGDGPLVDHDAGLEQDRFDPHFDHLLLIDREAGDAVVGAYRLLLGDKRSEVGQFYTEDEYDLTVLHQSGRRLLELGRSCLASDYRGGEGMYHLFNGLARYVFENDVEILFGVASFHGTDPQALAEPLSLLHQRHLAPEGLRVRAQRGHYQSMNLMPEDAIDRRRAMRQVPALLKAYLRLGGFVGDGAFVDHPFNTTDICLVMDTQRMNASQKSIYTKSVTA